MSPSSKPDLYTRAAQKIIAEQRLGLLTDALVAVVEAVRQPDVEAKFLYRRSEDLITGSEVLSIHLHDQIDWKQTRALAAEIVLGDDICIELKNGSCIRFVYEALKKNS